MDFRLTPEQTGLRDGIRAWLEGEHGPEVLRRLDAGDGRDPAIWDGLAALGLTGLLVGEAQGGLGLGLVEGVLAAIELGRANVSEPIVDTALVAAPLLDADAQARIAAGMLKVALAHPVNPWIADLDQAGLLFPGPHPHEHDGPRRLESVDPLRRLFAPVPAEADGQVLDRSALMAAAQLVGGAERMLALATEYAGQRKQFGQPIGAFQAVKHQLATVAVKIEFARPLVLRAAWTAEARRRRAPLHISHAKVAATDAAMLAAETAIQVHGAMGYTYEVDLHYWMKRAWALAGAWGDRAFHLLRIEEALGDGKDLGPDHVFESEPNHA